MMIDTGEKKDVVIKRASDEELALASWDAHSRHRAPDETWENTTPGARQWHFDSAAAVRARVEAPLLAEIAEHRRHLGIVMGRETELKAELRASSVENKRLNDMYGLVYAQSVTAERDTLKARVEELEAGKAGWCERDRGNPLLEMAELREKMGAVKEELTALRPWLRQPTGWELDVTPNEAMRAYCETYHEGAQKDWQAVLDLCRSRIRPTFECAECAKMKEQRKAFRKIVIDGAEEVRNRIDAARAALEGE